MLNEFVGTRLTLFPEGSLDSSVITTVFVGVWIVSFFNLTLGWTFSGLVVPGYLAPMLVAKPWAAGVIIVEAVCAYLLVRFVTWFLEGCGIACEFFGRDRFFALVLASVAMRIGFDGYLLPGLGSYLNQHFHLDFDYHNELHSFGLIIVSLIANLFWKPGLRRGLLTLAVTTGLTYAIVYYGLMQYTNFSIGNLNYTYEEIAISLESSPKSYIILLVTAWIASWYNLKFSWEFNGILIPGLLALQWYDPQKILSTVCESAVVYFSASCFLQAPFVRQMSFEGARKLQVFFTIAFIYKMFLGFILPQMIPLYRVSDSFGFGYLTCTLIAMKAHEKQIALRMLRTIGQVSIVGAMLGSVVGFVLYLSIPKGEDPTRYRRYEIDAGQPYARTLLVDRLRSDEARPHVLPGRPFPQPLSRSKALAFERGLGEIKLYLQSSDSRVLSNARFWFRQANLDVDLLEERFLYIHELPPIAHRGRMVINLQAKSPLTLIIPPQEDSWAMLESADTLLRLTDASLLVISPEQTDDSGGKQTEHELLTLLERQFPLRHQLELRGISSESVVQGAGRATESTLSILAISDKLPVSLLKQLIEPLQCVWDEPTNQPSNFLRPLNTGTRASLRLTRSGRQSLIETGSLMLRKVMSTSTGTDTAATKSSQSVAPKFAGSPTNPPLTDRSSNNSTRDHEKVDRSESPKTSLAGSAKSDQPVSKEAGMGSRLPLAVSGQPVKNWLLKRIDRIAPAGTNLYQQPTEAELLFFDRHVLTPIIRTMHRNSSNQNIQPMVISGQSTSRQNLLTVDDPVPLLTVLQQSPELRLANEHARLFGYEMILFPASERFGPSLCLFESEAPAEGALRRCWGTYLFQIHDRKPYLIQVPRPLEERNVYEYGVELVDRLDAALLALAGAHPGTNVTGESDLGLARNRSSLFNLVGQIYMRELGPQPAMLMQIRGTSVDPNWPRQADIVFAAGSAADRKEHLTKLERELFDTIQSERLAIKFVDGSPEVAGYGFGSPQALYLEQSSNKETVNLWLGPLFRRGFRQQPDQLNAEAHFRALGITSVTCELVERLFAIASSKKVSQRTLRLGAEEKQLINHYLISQDIVALDRLINHFGMSRLSRVVDAESQQAFLLIASDTASELPAVVALAPTDSVNETLAKSLSPDIIRKFIFERATYLTIEESR